ncbi:MAG: TIGR02186 family protein [Pikeienuella sp.]
MSRLVAIFALILGAFSAQAEGVERVVAALSQNAVSITTDFSGSQIFVYGAVERDRLPDNRDDNLDVIVTISGPQQPVIVRKKDNSVGIWINRERVKIDHAPSFYAVSTTGEMNEILDQIEDLRHKISVERAIRLVGAAGEVDDPQEFSDAIVRIRRASGIYFEQIGAVEKFGRTLFQTRVQLPANIIEGDYNAKIFLLRDGAVLDSYEVAIDVRKVGLERWIYNLAHEQPLMYGILSIIVALVFGWGASEIFRLLRR